MHTTRHQRRLAGATLLGFALAFPGCATQDAANVVHVQGTVTVDGKPLPVGMIVFEPDPAKGNSGPQGHADVKDGQFNTRSSKKGTVVGPLLVRITGGDGINPEPFTPFGTLLFEEHTVRIDLSKDQTTLQFDVPGAKSRKKIN